MTRLTWNQYWIGINKLTVYHQVFIQVDRYIVFKLIHKIILQLTPQLMYSGN